MKKLLAMLLAITMLLSLAACVGPDTPDNTGSSDSTGTTDNTGTGVNDNQSKYGGHLNFISEMKPDNLDPAKSTGVYKYMFTNLVYEAPLTRDAEGNIRPNVCEFELSEDSLTLKLWVREGVTFHDGSTVEIEDVVASIQRCVHKSPRNYVSAYIKDVQIADGVATITFTEYNEKTMYYIACVHPFVGVMPKEICEKYSYESEQIITDVADAIGTGPYKFTELVSEVSLSVERYDGYVPVEEGYTGAAAPKMAYMDTITFIASTDESSRALTLLGGEADLAENIAQDYRDQAAAAGIVSEGIDYTAGLEIIFNTFGSNPSSANTALRKAIVAAIDIPEFVQFVHEDSYTVTGNPALDAAYQNDAFNNADYMGADNLDVVKKYLDAAGYKGETIKYVCAAPDSKFATLVESYLKAAGITVEISIMEEEAFMEHTAVPSNDWDFMLGYNSLNNTPTLLSDNIMKTNYNSAEKDTLLAELASMPVGSDAYMAKWDELAQQMVDDCATVVMGQSKLVWFMNEELNINYDGILPYLWNAYWNDPENHGK